MWIDIICLLTIYFSFNYMYTLYYRRFMVDYCNKYTFLDLELLALCLLKWFTQCLDTSIAIVVEIIVFLHLFLERTMSASSLRLVHKIQIVFIGSKVLFQFDKSLIKTSICFTSQVGPIKVQLII